MRRHRNGIDLSESQKKPGQRHFLGSLCSLKAPRASNGRHGGQFVLLRAEQTAATITPRDSPCSLQTSIRSHHIVAHTTLGRRGGPVSSGVQHSASVSEGFSPADAEDLAPYQGKFRRRLPESLVATHWPDTLRVAGALVTHQIRACAQLRMFGRERHPTPLGGRRSQSTGGTTRPCTCLLWQTRSTTPTGGC